MVINKDENCPLAFIYPVDGDCITPKECKKTGAGVELSVKLRALPDHDITVCGTKAVWDGEYYVANVVIYGIKNTIKAVDNTSNQSCMITVCYLPMAYNKYRLFSDDNILFLADINANKDVYKSIFDNEYLSIYKKAHDLYGAKVHINLFYEFNEASAKSFGDDRPYFNLSMMTDRFKDEFIANSDWLKLAFHANSDYPPNPYGEADAEQISRDCICVNKEIIRFAGAGSLSDCTTIHFAKTTEEGTRALRSLGYRSLEGDFVENEKYPCNYHYDMKKVRHVMKRDFFYDRDIDIFFCRTDVVLNAKQCDYNLNKLGELINNPTEGGFIGLLMHEQYYYKDYKYHIPDFEARILEPCKFLWENGYSGAFISEILKERHVNEFPYDAVEKIKI